MPVCNQIQSNELKNLVYQFKGAFNRTFRPNVVFYTFPFVSELFLCAFSHGDMHQHYQNQKLIAENMLCNKFHAFEQLKRRVSRLTPDVKCLLSDSKSEDLHGHI